VENSNVPVLNATAYHEESDLVVHFGKANFVESLKLVECNWFHFLRENIEVLVV
jgi:hypothetical protein